MGTRKQIASEKKRCNAPALPVEQVLAMYLNDTIEYGDGSCHHDGCGGHHHHYE